MADITPATTRRVPKLHYADELRFSSMMCCQVREGISSAIFHRYRAMSTL